MNEQFKDIKTNLDFNEMVKVKEDRGEYCHDPNYSGKKGYVKDILILDDRINYYIYMLDDGRVCRFTTDELISLNKSHNSAVDKYDIKFRIWYKDIRKMDYSTIEYFDNKLVFTFEHFINKDNISLMRYTGITDCEGQEIYEGDIVGGEVQLYGMPFDVEGVVRYMHSRFVIDMCNCPLYEFHEDLSSDNTWLKVVGNEYENPELIIDLLEGLDNEVYKKTRNN